MWKQSHQPGVCCREWTTVARTPCLVSRTLFPWGGHLLLSQQFCSFYLFLVSLETGRPRKTLYLKSIAPSASCWCLWQLHGSRSGQTALPQVSLGSPGAAPVPWSPEDSAKQRWPSRSLSCLEPARPRGFLGALLFTCAQLKRGHTSKNKK